MSVAQFSHVGRRRERNEDAVYADEDRRLYVVADGMGGHPAGDVASKLAVEVVSKRFNELTTSLPAMNRLSVAIQCANEVIFRRSRDLESERGMGTTVVAATLEPKGHVTVAHVGDSRAYLLSQGKLYQLTADHGHAHLLYRAVGIEADIVPTLNVYRVRKGDVLLLCSDGLHGELDAKSLVNLLAAPIADLAPSLLHAALEHGGRDNVSAIVVRI